MIQATIPLPKAIVSAKELRLRTRIARAEAAMHLALKDLNRALTRAAKCEARVIELRKGAQE